ncbi:DoxX family protein [Mycobacterium sp. MYCO198283]|uniref:DoxX family protein n=1 Tax=Mycobacterium sp. MYCO198283 TaxID=2883505 RepID=UPI001E2B82EB|nr:DoxX family protein [Mycobacterium sp. MYCO198283]MCG5434384.1 DoxX family protein [Mycobacterium sp. MYCO198283]
MTTDHQDSRLWQRPDETATRAASRPASASLVDPEDDLLPGDTYGGNYGGGDFTTTNIPRYDSGTGSAASGFGVLGDPEPLPYVQPARTARHAADGPDTGYDDFYEDRVRDAGRRGTQDLGLAVLRIGVGVLFVAHGLRDAFGLWGGPGMSGFGASLTEVGFRSAGALAIVFPGIELVAGVLLILGLFTPMAGAALLAFMVNVFLGNLTAQHDDGFVTLFLPGGNEYQLTLLVALSAVILSGPGRYGLDISRGWARRPFVGSATAWVLGIGAGVALWWLLNGTNPLG